MDKHNLKSLEKAYERMLLVLGDLREEWEDETDSVRSSDYAYMAANLDGAITLLERAYETMKSYQK